METLIGMGAILFGLGGVVVSITGVITILVGLPDLVRIARIVRAKPVPTREVGLGTVAVQGLVPLDAATCPALADGRPIVFSKLTVFEQVGKHVHERLAAVRGVPFEVDDGKDRIRVLPEGGKVLAPLVLGGPANDAVLLAAEGTFAWPKTPKTFFEETVVPGDFVTVYGVAVAGAEGKVIEQAWIMRGEPRLMATGEARTVLWGIAAIPGGMLLSGVSWLVLQATI